MSFWKKKKPFDITAPITNPGLKKAIAVFNSNKSERTLQTFTAVLRTASFLVLIDTRGLKLPDTDEAGNTFLKKEVYLNSLRPMTKTKIHIFQYLPIGTKLIYG